MSEHKKLFGLRLVVVRKSRGLSQEDLALESGLARSYLSGVERGVRNISLVNICRLAAALKVGPDELMRFQDADLLTADQSGSQ